ncbi:unnamed protein product [Prunus armeniaca]
MKLPLPLLSRGPQTRRPNSRSGLDGDIFVGNALISMYSRLRWLIEARSVFDEMANEDLISWNAILSGYSQEGNHGLVAIFVFIEMVAEGMGKLVEEGEMIHGFCIKTGFLSKHNVCNSLITMYAKLESMHDSIKVFEELNIMTRPEFLGIRDGSCELFSKFFVYYNYCYGNNKIENLKINVHVTITGGLLVGDGRAKGTWYSSQPHYRVKLLQLTNVEERPWDVY